MDRSSNQGSQAKVVLQKAIELLLKWTDRSLPSNYSVPEDSAAIQRAKELLSWTDDREIGALQLLFDRVCLKPDQKRELTHYVPMQAIASPDLDVMDPEKSYPPIFYPVKQEPSSETENHFKQEMQSAVLEVLEERENWQNLSLLMLIVEKYGSCLSFGDSDVALVDKVRLTAAVAEALADDSGATHLSLIAGDLSGIQDFIYTISSDGALKSLRARSFYLELITEEVVQQLLTALELPRTSVIYAGGGNLYLLASKDAVEAVQKVQKQFNCWLRKEFQKKIFLALTCVEFPTLDISTRKFTDYWQEAIHQLNKQKSRKFADQISDVLKPERSYEQTCRVCHRDDVEEKNLKPLKEPDSPLACPVCRNMFGLGGILFKVNCAVRSSRPPQKNEENVLGIELPVTPDRPASNHYYRMYEHWKQVENTSDAVFLINDWEIEHYKFRHFPHVSPLLLGNYGQISQTETGFMTANEFTKTAEGIDRVGYLRMDVDNLGQIFAKGLQHCFSLPRLAGLSRQMSYFFKVYLNSLADDRSTNFFAQSDAHGFKALRNQLRTDQDNKHDQKHLRKNLLFIYAGGDDLFVSGAWDEIIEFAFDVYQSFRSYTGHNPDITLSGGISIETAKFPLYQAAEAAGIAEKAAKSGGRDRLGLFNQVFQWQEWLGTVQLQNLDEKAVSYLDPAKQPDYFGVWQFVEQLQKLSGSYTRSLVRNLLITAELQESRIREKQAQIDQRKKSLRPSEYDQDLMIKQLKQESEEIRYYLHLPSIAYTLARLPDHLKSDTSPFKSVRTSLKSPYNAPYFRAIATWIELLNRKAEP